MDDDIDTFDGFFHISKNIFNASDSFSFIFDPFSICGKAITMQRNF